LPERQQGENEEGKPLAVALLYQSIAIRKILLSVTLVELTPDLFCGST